MALCHFAFAVLLCVLFPASVMEWVVRAWSELTQSRSCSRHAKEPPHVFVLWLVPGYWWLYLPSQGQKLWHAGALWEKGVKCGRLRCCHGCNKGIADSQNFFSVLFWPKNLSQGITHLILISLIFLTRLIHLNPVLILLSVLQYVAHFMSGVDKRLVFKTDTARLFVRKNSQE